jgi:hypothetical protein
MNCHQYGPCSYSPILIIVLVIVHPVDNSIIFHEQMNTNFSSLGFESNSNFYNLDWSNYPNFSWQAQAMGNCAPQFHELHHREYSQFENQVFHPSSYDHLPQKSSLEDTLKEFIERTGQSTIHVSQPKSSLEDTLKVFMERTGQSTIQEIKDATMANILAIERLE